MSQLAVYQSMEKFYQKLLPHVSDEKKNCVFSPYSIFSVLAMTSGGSDGNTRTEFNEALCIDQSTVHEDMKKLHRVFEKSKAKPVSVAEAVFTQVEVSKYFEKLCKETYGGLVKATKFPQPGEKEVNEFVEKHTRGMIKDVVKNLDGSTIMILVNAIYFKADWLTPFVKKFTNADYLFNHYEKKGKCSMMMRRATSEMYGKHKIGGESFFSCMLPYKGREYGMLFIKPVKEGPEAMFNCLKNSICAAEGFFHKVLSSQQQKKLTRLMVPKFNIDTKFQVNDPLKNIGLRDAFKSSANFSKITAEMPLMIDEVIHVARIIVDEKGTEAAAATVVKKKKGKARRKAETFEFVLDRPFFCYIVHLQSSTVLFHTTVVQPNRK